MKQDSKSESADISDKIIKNVGNYLNLIKNCKRKSVFRGQSNVEWSLLPSILRQNNCTPEKEKQLFLEFKMEYYQYTTERPKNDMELLFLAQHYGLPTRLIDWSYNPLVALFFACNSNEDKDGVVYCKTLEGEIREKNEGDNKPMTINQIINNDKSLFVIPDRTDVRYINQKALFMLCGKDCQEKEKLDKYIINKKYKKDIIEELTLLGFDEHFIFPSLDKLCSDITKKIFK